MTKQYDGPAPEGCTADGNDSDFHLGLGLGEPWHDKLVEDTYQATLKRIGFDKFGRKVEPASEEVTAKVAAAPALSKAIADLEGLI